MREHQVSNWADREAVCQWFNTFDHKWLPEQWADASHVVTLDGDAIHIVLPFASQDIDHSLTLWWKEACRDFPELMTKTLSVTHRVQSLASAGESLPLKGVKNVIVVSSAKGGVGKSTTAVNLALGLQVQGARVGLLDADIYGPSVPLMLGKQDENPTSADGKMMQPIEAYGLYTNSIGYLVPAENAMVWRGPMASKALAQIVTETIWPELDYLVIDMPPGTGDIQLTLAQQIPVTAAVVITTPQDLALADAIKGVSMFQKVDIPVLGVVENMSYHICSNCGHHEAIFGTGGAVKMAEQYHLPLLAQLPLDMKIRQDIDAGKPTVVADPDSDQAKAYCDLAGEVASRLYWQGTPVVEQITIRMV